MKKNFLFLGFAIPDEEMKETLKNDSFPAIQTHKFNWNIIKGIESQDIFDCTYISARPVSDYPYYKYKKINKRNWKINLLNKNIEITEIPFENCGIKKIITRFVYGFYYSIKE